MTVAIFVSLELLLNSGPELGPLILSFSSFFSFLFFFPFLSFPLSISPCSHPASQPQTFPDHTVCALSQTVWGTSLPSPSLGKNQ